MHTTIKTKPIRLESHPDGEPLLNNTTLSPRPRVTVRSRLEYPDSGKFHVVARSCPQLQELVTNVKLHAVSKSVHLTCEENSTFDVFRWFITLNERRQMLMSSPFKDLEQESMVICFFDSYEREVGRWKVSGLSLLSHECGLGRPEDAAKFQPLTHQLVLLYDKAEVLEVKSVADDAPLTQNEIADEEWSQINLSVRDNNEFYSRLP